MKYAHKKAIKGFIKKIDERYLGGRLRRSVRQQHVPMASEEITPEQKAAARQEVIYQVNRPLPSDSEIRRVEIIILKYKDPEVEVKCAQHLLENTEWPYKLVFFDNRPGTKNMAKIWNKLIRESTCDYVALMDSDAFVPKMEPCWLTRCMQTFDMYPDCYAVSPMLDNISFPQQRAATPRNTKPEKCVEEFANTCMVFKKDLFEKVGYYDEDFLIYGADPEHAYRVVKSPYAAYLRPDVVVGHEWHHSAKKAAAKQEYNKVAEKEYCTELLKKKTGGTNTAD